MSSNGLGLEVVGLNKVMRDLQQLGLEVDDLKDAMSNIADEAAQVARRVTPTRSGELVSTIRGNRAKGKATVTWGYSRRGFYAGPVQWGWGSGNNNYKHGNSGSGIRGNYGGAHFFEKVDDVMAPRAIQMLEDEVNEQIRKRGLD